MFQRSLLRAITPSAKLPDGVEIVTQSGVRVTIAVRVSDRAKRLLLKFNPIEDRFELVVPRGVRLNDVTRFAEAQQGWIAARLGSAPPRILFQPGETIPILDVPHRIEHAPGSGVPVRLEPGVLIVTGKPEHISRRIRDFLRARARAELGDAARHYAAEIGKPIKGISLNDPKSRWGSCSSRGTLCFSWRLIFAPPKVLRYVAAHEVAHLVEMNHGPKFWAEVAHLVGPHQTERAWLTRNATRLQRLG